MPKKSPEFAPVEVPNLICWGCGNRLRLKIDRYTNGKIQAITYYCDSCEYGFASSMPHHNGQMTKHVPVESKAPETDEVKSGQEKKPSPQLPARGW